MTVALEVLRRFDAELWQVARPLPPPGETTLLTWKETPPAVDAGVPEPVRNSLAAALCGLGVVVYAGAGEAGSVPVCAELPVRRHFRTLNIRLRCASASAELFPAFTDPDHDWTMSAQWLVVLDSLSGVEEAHAFLGQLFGAWNIPEVWPRPVLLVVQAAVDGDGAACHAASSDVQARFLIALGNEARNCAIALKVQPA